jgi:hypothetical protein
MYPSQYHRNKRVLMLSGLDSNSDKINYPIQTLDWIEDFHLQTFILNERNIYTVVAEEK